MRDWYALGLMDLSEVAQGVAAMPDLPQADGFFTEVKAWGRDSVIFADILATAMRTSRDYHFSQAVETLAASAKGLQIVADFVAGVDYREFGEYYLDALAVLLSSNKYKELAQRLLNALPLSFFEQEDVFVHVCHSGLYAKLLRYYQPAAREIAIMGQELDNLSPESMITSALERYKKRKAALQSVDTTKRETGGVDWRVQNFKVKIDTNENNISTAMDNIARSYAGLTFALTDMEKVTPAELSISF